MLDKGIEEGDGMVIEKMIINLILFNISIFASMVSEGVLSISFSFIAGISSASCFVNGIDYLTNKKEVKG